MLPNMYEKQRGKYLMNKHIDKMGKWYILVTFGVSLYVQLQNIDTLMSLAEKLLSIFTPFIYGLGIAYLIDVLVRWLTSKYFKIKEDQQYL